MPRVTGSRRTAVLLVCAGLVALVLAVDARVATARTAAVAAPPPPVVEELRREAARDSLRREIQRYSEMVRALRDSLGVTDEIAGRDGRVLEEVGEAIGSLSEAIGSIAEQISALQVEIDAGRFSLRDGQGGRVTVDLPPDLGERISQGLASITRVILEEIPDTLRFSDGSSSYAWDWGGRPPGVPAPPPAPERLIRGDIIKFNDDLEVARGEVVEGNVVSIRGDVRVKGRIKGDLVVVLGNVNLEESATIDGEIVLVLGRLEQMDGARTGALTVIHPGDGLILRRLDQPRGSWRAFWIWQGLFVISAGLVLLVLVLLPRDRLAAISEVLQRRTAASLGLGLLLLGPGHATVLGLGALLFLTVIGIPVAALALLALALVDLAAIGLASVIIGRAVCGGLRLGCRHPAQAAALGLLVLHLPALAAAFGAAAGLPALAVHLLVWSGRLCKLAALAAGLGAMVLGRFGAARTRSAQPIAPTWSADPVGR